MSKAQLTDSEAKDIMRGWPRATKKLFGGSDDRLWVRAQPKNNGDRATTPYILVAGNTALKTQPDGLYIRPVERFRAFDIIAFEHCSQLQNLQDKRSRYAPATASLILETRADWWNESIDGAITRWQKICGKGEKCADNLWTPLRHVRVVYVLKNDDLNKFRKHGVPSGHEFFIRHSSLGSMTAKKFLSFLARLSPDTHFYTR